MFLELDYQWGACHLLSNFSTETEILCFLTLTEFHNLKETVTMFEKTRELLSFYECFASTPHELSFQTIFEGRSPRSDIPEPAPPP